MMKLDYHDGNVCSHMNCGTVIVSLSFSKNAFHDHRFVFYRDVIDFGLERTILTENVMIHLMIRKMCYCLNMKYCV